MRTLHEIRARRNFAKDQLSQTAAEARLLYSTKNKAKKACCHRGNGRRTMCCIPPYFASSDVAQKRFQSSSTLDVRTTHGVCSLQEIIAYLVVISTTVLNMSFYLHCTRVSPKASAYKIRRHNINDKNEVIRYATQQSMPIFNTNLSSTTSHPHTTSEKK